MKGTNLGKNREKVMQSAKSASLALGTTLQKMKETTMKDEIPIEV